MEAIIDWDIDLFLFLNHLQLDWLNPIMLAISGKLTWIPLYGLLLWLLYKKQVPKELIITLIFVVLLIVMSDQSSVHLFKNTFQRLRPCHNPDIRDQVSLLKGCGGQFGFVSSHATNTFSLAVFIGILLSRQWLIFLLLWAALVSYSRVYIGVHYPLDILGGAVLGTVIALVLIRIRNKVVISI